MRPERNHSKTATHISGSVTVYSENTCNSIALMSRISTNLNIPCNSVVYMYMTQRDPGSEGFNP